MDSFFVDDLPSSQDEAKQSIYGGSVYLLKANDASLQLVNQTIERIQQEVGTDFREAHLAFSAEEFFVRIGKLRKQIYTSNDFHQLLNAVIASLGFQLNRTAYDPARIRVISPGGHLNPAASAIYYGHRDTWYANSQSMITWWIPLHAIGEDESFDFYPEQFLKPVKNDSEIFDFEVWTRDGQKNRIGWQDKKTGEVESYPRLLEKPDGLKATVVAQAGDILLFSAQHLHQTRPNTTIKSRFSLDFRTVDINDHATNIGASNVDNRSTGSSLSQFVRPK